MKCPKISNPNEFVELTVIDKGLQDLYSAERNVHAGYVTLFEIKNEDKTYKRYYSIVDKALVDESGLPTLIRFKYDADFLRKHDISLAEYAGNMP